MLIPYNHDNLKTLKIFQCYIYPLFSQFSALLVFSVIFSDIFSDAVISVTFLSILNVSVTALLDHLNIEFVGTRLRGQQRK